MGVGRSGKTATIRSLQAKPFVDTPSTVGLERLDVKVNLHKATAGPSAAGGKSAANEIGEEEARWGETVLPKKELEAAILRGMEQAQIAVAVEEQKEEGEDTRPSQPPATQPSAAVVRDASSPIAGGSSLTSPPPAAVPGAVSALPKAASEPPSQRSQLPPQVQLDEAFLVRAMKDKAQASSSLIISITDMGGKITMRSCHFCLFDFVIKHHFPHLFNY
jgi:hypothetical protein